MADSMKPGGGGRFKALEGKLEHRKGVTDPGALAAYIGRRKYGLNGPFRQPYTAIHQWKVVATKLCGTRSAGETVPVPPGQHQTPNFAA